MKNEDLNNSGFILSGEESISAHFSHYTLLPSKGFNELYKAKRYGKWHILKGLKKQFQDSETYRNLLQKEFELCVNLNHPNIVTAMTLEEDPMLGLCIVMEYVDGVTLAEFLQTSPSSETLRKVLVEILSAMQYFHSKQVIHRDLKPSNILITHNGNNVKIIDFGLADADSYTHLKQPAGTLCYAAPEQLEKGGFIDCRTDLFALGKILEYHFPRSYRHIASCCAQAEPSQRPANAASVLQMLGKSRRHTVAIIAGIVILILAILSVMIWNFSMKTDTEMKELANPALESGELEVTDSEDDGQEVKTEPASVPAQETGKDAGNEYSVLMGQMEKDLERLYRPFIKELKNSHYPNDAVPRMLVWNKSQEAQKEVVQPLLEKTPKNSELYIKIWEHYLVLQQKYDQQCFSICEKWISVKELRNTLDERLQKGEITRSQYDKIIDSLQLNEYQNWEMNEETLMYERRK